jgi:hypothetical protein
VDIARKPHFTQLALKILSQKVDIIYIDGGFANSAGVDNSTR